MLAASRASWTCTPGCYARPEATANGRELPGCPGGIRRPVRSRGPNDLFRRHSNQNRSCRAGESRRSRIQLTFGMYSKAAPRAPRAREAHSLLRVLRVIALADPQQDVAVEQT